jgi:diaminohydroxyphosphoribosylaminopyrimidine deaminase/5-amino-6-(5-phosphoribosylamino)uracil reductase
MTRCTELAKQAVGFVAPNPMVGAVIVYQDTVIGEGFHHGFGRDHAEVTAIQSVNNKSLLKDSTLFVNLEPCSHKGKTPPCAEFIVRNKIPTVVIGTPDPNPLVAGKGIQYLKKNGVEVLTGINQDLCIELNKRFYTYHICHRPYVILKWAQTKDGFIDIIRKPNHPATPSWISNELSRVLVHKWRSEEQAIMTGTNTIKLDDPMLNTREWSGNNPLRIILDRNLSLTDDFKIFKSDINTLIINEKKSYQRDNFEFVQLRFSENLIAEVMNELYKKNIQSVIVEGGKMLIESFIKQNLWDEARVFIGSKKFHQGIRAPGLNGKKDVNTILDDQLHIHRNPIDGIAEVKRFLQHLLISL